VNVLRRLPLPRLLLLCGLVVAIGASATALAFAVDSGPVPPSKPLARAVHDALAGGPVAGFTARVKLTNHLVEGTELAAGEGGGGGLAGNPLLTGAAGRVWVSDDGRLRLELQSERGDTQVIYDGHTLQLYDASDNTVYRYTPDHAADGHGDGWTGYAPLDRRRDAGADTHEPPTVAQVEEGIAHVREHAQLSGATPTDVGGQAAYTVRVSPKETGSLIGGAELSFDAGHGIPLRAAVYSSSSPDPVVELAADDVSYGPVADSVFAFTAPPGAKVEEIKPSDRKPDATDGSTEHPRLTTHGHGITAISVLEAKARPGSKGGDANAAEQLPKVKIGAATASELRTALGTVLTFERGGVRYLVAGAVSPAAVEALARGL
jgi:outer membrane lipoprotein-sorting protein